MPALVDSMHKSQDFFCQIVVTVSHVWVEHWVPHQTIATCSVLGSYIAHYDLPGSEAMESLIICANDLHRAEFTSGWINGFTRVVQ